MAGDLSLTARENIFIMLSASRMTCSSCPSFLIFVTSFVNFFAGFDGVFGESLPQQWSNTINFFWAYLSTPPFFRVLSTSIMPLGYRCYLLCSLNRRWWVLGIRVYLCSVSKGVSFRFVLVVLPSWGLLVCFPFRLFWQRKVLSGFSIGRQK